jgi:hypothetical protein
MFEPIAETPSHAQKVIPPNRIDHWLSGFDSHSRAFRDPRLYAYFCMLFHVIQHQAPTDVVLSGIFACAFGSLNVSKVLGWDLFHGHMFVHVVEDGADIVADLGILFHSKEYPEEYGNNTGRYPIGCPGILLSLWFV